MDRVLINYVHDNDTSHIKNYERTNIVMEALVRYTLTEGDVSVTADFVHSINTYGAYFNQDFIDLADVTPENVLEWIDSSPDRNFNKFSDSLRKVLENKLNTTDTKITV